MRTTPLKRSLARLAEAVDLYERGELDLVLRGVFPLAGVAEAHKIVATGHGRGKVVLVIEGS
ncbi:hypothetical protein GCM10010468_35340 [Actinocorallia longicatena]|uniref:Zinc-binding alcohol dehydrogenase family protein n=1 Tax=Actinocorallia longicatena TaxID=111803 RepID=A0ABP6QDF3_9ACTN